ncbi:MAG: anti-sigma factor domain-containing protein [Bacteroidota bacterium]
MSAQEFIESGLLHVYVLGATTADESRHVELMAEQWPEVKAELERLQLETEAYAGMHAFQPRATLRDTIIAHVLEQELPAQRSSDNGRVIPLQSAVQPARIWKAAAVVAGILLIGSAAFNIITYGNLRDADKRIASLESEKTAFAQQTKLNQTRYDSINNIYTAYYQQHQATITELSTLYHPTVVAIKAKDSNNQAVVFWCNRSKTVCIDPGTMPNPDASKQYQLWAIVKGKPVDVGVFDAAPANKLQLLKIIPDAEAFAITVEKHGGVPAPEGPMVAIASL